MNGRDAVFLGTRYHGDWPDSVLLAPRYPVDWRDSVFLAPQVPEDWWDLVLLAPRCLRTGGTQSFWPPRLSLIHI